MKLADIQEHNNREADSDEDGRSQLSVVEADALFYTGISAMDAGDIDEAFRNFDRICRDCHDAPFDMLRAARALRTWLDTNVAPDEKAVMLLRFFKPTLIHVYDAERDGPLQHS